MERQSLKFSGAVPGVAISQARAQRFSRPRLDIPIFLRYINL